MEKVSCLLLVFALVHSSPRLFAERNPCEKHGDHAHVPFQEKDVAVCTVIKQLVTSDPILNREIDDSTKFNVMTAHLVSMVNDSGVLKTSQEAKLVRKMSKTMDLLCKNSQCDRADVSSDADDPNTESDAYDVGILNHQSIDLMRVVNNQALLQTDAKAKLIARMKRVMDCISKRTSTVSSLHAAPPPARLFYSFYLQAPVSSLC